MTSKLFLAAFIALTTIGAHAQKGPKPSPTPVPVITATFNYCAAGDTMCESDNRLRSDANRPYTHGQEGVRIELYSGPNASRDLIFRLDGSTRTVVFDLRDTWTPGAVPAWWATAPQQNVKPQMNVLGALNAKEGCATPTEGCTFVTRLNAGYWKAAGVNNTTYAMLWNPTTINPRPVNDPYRTSNVLVHYIQDGQGELFTITPIANGGTTEPGDMIVAGLEATRNQSVTGAGQYRMPFTLQVRRR